MNTTFSVPNVIFLQAPEFSGEDVRPKNYENGQKDKFGFSVISEFDPLLGMQLH